MIWFLFVKEKKIVGIVKESIAVLLGVVIMAIESHPHEKVQTFLFIYMLNKFDYILNFQKEREKLHFHFDFSKNKK